MCVVSVSAVKPNVAAPPLIECAARKIAARSSGSGEATSRFSSSCSICASSSSASSKNVW
ncbi:chemotaxis two-component sensor kinase CheA domain protein [Burkholderia mallei]|nr:chemotaxis two-component sensor kinase CheA domain protein [Burkholderia mallei]KOS99852.1 chemotaxis two-component sensor kinase CheA domain protein [Burkholderia mallei]